MEKRKIVLDADVLIHFAKAGRLSFLPKIFPEYNYIILSIVYDEVRTLHRQLDNQILFLKNIKREDFCPNSDMLDEYKQLILRYGKGESACMAYCQYTKDVVGSSNMRDIKNYCKNHHIDYLTTLDFLYYAYKRKLMTLEECDEFIRTVKAANSKLPDDVDITKHQPSTVISLPAAS